MALTEPTRRDWRIFSIHSYQLHTAWPSLAAAPRGKGYFMTFDPERYRAHIAPLKLTREQENELLSDLWKITEVLVDQSILSPTYPLQFAIACQAFDAVEQAIAVKSEGTKATKEEAL